MTVTPAHLIWLGSALILLAVVLMVVWGLGPFDRTLYIDKECPGENPCDDFAAWHECCVTAVLADKSPGIGWMEAISGCTDLAKTVECAEAAP